MRLDMRANAGGCNLTSGIFDCKPITRCYYDVNDQGILDFNHIVISFVFAQNIVGDHE